MLKFVALGSGSSGNSALVYTNDTCILVDAGISCKQLCLRMEAVGISPENLDGILLTHEHGDHTRGLAVFGRKHKTPVYCNPVTRESIEASLGDDTSWRMIEAGTAFDIGDVRVNPFTVMHDAVDPMGFCFECCVTGARLGFASDVGHVTGGMRAALAGVHSLFLEANYDDVMLQNDTKRPWSLKQRIASRHGHLSNAQAADLVTEVAAGGQLQRVMLGHLSEDCNSAEVAESAIRVALQRQRLNKVIEVSVAQRDVPTGPYAVDSNAVAPKPSRATDDIAEEGLSALPNPPEEPLSDRAAELPPEEQTEFSLFS